MGLSISRTCSPLARSQVARPRPQLPQPSITQHRVPGCIGEGDQFGEPVWLRGDREAAMDLAGVRGDDGRRVVVLVRVDADDDVDGVGEDGHCRV